MILEGGALQTPPPDFSRGAGLLLRFTEHPYQKFARATQPKHISIYGSKKENSALKALFGGPKPLTKILSKSADMQESYVSSNGNMMDLDRVINIKACCLVHQNKDLTIIIVEIHKNNSGAALAKSL